LRRRGALGYLPQATGAACYAAILAMGVALLGGGRLATTANADGPASSSERELRIERTLACPQCTDLPLDVCDQDICADMRSIVHQKVTGGESDAAIRQYFVDRYGGRVLLAPPKMAGSLLIWILPFAALLLGAACVVLFARTARVRTRDLTSGDRDRVTAIGYRAWVERDVQELE
jgi:cytochrome c-type biogenesis protein CcmH